MVGYKEPPATNHRPPTTNHYLMIIGRIIGNVVATRKDPRLEGKKLLLVRPITVTGEDESSYLVAVDTVGAGYREKVLVTVEVTD